MVSLFNYFNRWNIEFSFGNFLGPCNSLMHSKSSNSVQFSCSVVSDSLRPHEPQHGRPPCPSPTPGGWWELSIESVMPSNHLNLCHPLLLLPSIFPNIRVFSNESRWPNSWVFASGGQNIVKIMKMGSLTRAGSYTPCPSQGTWYCDSDGGQWNLMSDSYLCRCACAHLYINTFLFWNNLPRFCFVLFCFVFNSACHMRFFSVFTLSIETVLILPATSVLLAFLSAHGTYVNDFHF